MKPQISFVRAFEDNYIWIIHNIDYAIVIDPGDAKPVINFLLEHEIKLKAILLTHLHADHNGGVNELTGHYPSVEVISNKKMEIHDEDIISINGFPSFTVITTPGHVYEHVCYLFAGRHLFCGDTLFSLGCGRVFTNDFTAAYNSLNKIKNLSDNVLCYPAHEYTLNNMTFCMKVNPSKYSKLYNDVENKLELTGSTLPTLLSYEKELNPFLRCDDIKLQEIVTEKYDVDVFNKPLECFKVLRTIRNKF